MEKFKETDIVPFSFWRKLSDDSYVYVKSYDVGKRGFLPEGISSHFKKYVQDVIRKEKLHVNLVEIDIMIYMYNPKFYEFATVSAPVYELGVGGYFYKVENELEYTGKVPTQKTVREATNLYENVLKSKIHDVITMEKNKAFDKKFKEQSRDGYKAFLFGFSAQALLEIDSEKYEVSFLRKDSLGDFDILVKRRGL